MATKLIWSLRLAALAAPLALAAGVTPAVAAMPAPVAVAVANPAAPPAVQAVQYWRDGDWRQRELRREQWERHRRWCRYHGC